ncbi:hypothetical protein AB0L99_07105 [Streptomyces sp. NPDC051954]|uniref:hypothetical protein n=1 Tax=Streptomyces sp. NPDC051954 TaxID=3155524 RepID=UPI00342F6284
MSRVRGVQRLHGRLLRQLRRVLGLVGLHTGPEHARAHDTGAAGPDHTPASAPAPGSGARVH